MDEATKRLLLAMSAATIDRKLRPFRQQLGRGLSTTKPGTLLKQSIPVRTFADWEDTQPGSVEMHLVAHYGETTEGQYLHILTAVNGVGTTHGHQLDRVLCPAPTQPGRRLGGPFRACASTATMTAPLSMARS